MKKQKKPAGLSYTQFIFGIGQADALEIQARYYEEEKELKRIAREQQESSDRAEVRNREDAERSARTSAPRRSQEVDTEQQSTTSLMNQFGMPVGWNPFKPSTNKRSEKKKKDYITDAEYDILTGPEIQTNRNKTWYESAAGSLFDVMDYFHLPGAGERKWERGLLEKVAIAKDRENKKKELSKYTPEAIAAAEQRAEQRRMDANARLNSISTNSDTSKLPTGNYDEFDMLRQDIKRNIADREFEYRTVIGPTDDQIQQMQYQLQGATDTSNKIPRVDMPEGYNISTWGKDAWSQAMQNMNRAQRDEFVGYDERYEEMSGRLGNAAKKYQADIDLEELPWKLELLKKLQRGEQLTEGEITAITGRPDSKLLLMPGMVQKMISDAEKRINAAKYDQYRYAKDAEFVESWDPNVEWSITRPGRTASQMVGRSISYINKAVDDLTDSWYDDYSWTSKFSNEIDALNENIAGIRSASPREKIALINKYKAAGTEKQKKWQKGIESNQKDIDKWKQKHDVSDYFLYREQTSDGAFYKPGTWLYKQPGLWGSSQASWIKQTGSLAMNTVGALIPGSVAVRAILGTASLGVATSSGVSENSSESAENFRGRLKSILQSRGLINKFLKSNEQATNGKTIEETIEEYSLNPWRFSDSDLDQAAFDSHTGLNAAFQDNMSAVLGDNVFDTYLQISPIHNYLRASKPTQASKISNALKGNFSSISPAAQPIASGIKHFGGKAISSLSKTAIGKSVKRQTQGVLQFAEKIPSRILGDRQYKRALARARRLGRNTFGRNSVPRRILTADQYVVYQTAKDVVKDITKKAVASSISEGIEEGKQYLHGQAFIRGEYDDDTKKGILNLERIINDIAGGSQSAIAMLSMLPFVPATTSDADFIENIKGGMLGGAFGTGTQRLFFGGIDAVQQYKMNAFVSNEIALEKQAQRDVYLKAKEYAKKASSSSAIGRLMYTFDKYADAMQHLVDNGRTDVTKDDVQQIKDLKTFANNVIGLANSDAIQEAATKLGIDTKSDKFYEYVGTYAMADDSQQQGYDRYKEAIDPLNTLIQGIQTPFELTEDGKVMHNITVANALRMQQEVNLKDADGNPLEGQALLDEAVARYRQNIRSYAKIAALQQLKNDLEAVLTNMEELGFNSRGIKDVQFQFNRVKSELRAELMKYKPDAVKRISENARSYISHLDQADEMIRLSRLAQLAQIDIDYYTAIKTGLLGEYVYGEEYTRDKEITEDFRNAGHKQVLDFVDGMEKSIEDDKELMRRIERDWVHQWGDAQTKRVDNAEKARRKIFNLTEPENLVRDLEDAEEDALIGEAGAMDINLRGGQVDVQTTQEQQNHVDEQPTPTPEPEPTPEHEQTSRTDQQQPVETPPETKPKRKKYSKPETTLGNTKLRRPFEEMQDYLNQLANVSAIDLMEVREETTAAVKRLADRINAWMEKTLSTEEEDLFQLNEESTQLMFDAEALLKSIATEIVWATDHGIYRNEIDFRKAETLQRAYYDDQELERLSIPPQLMLERDIRDTFGILTDKLYKLGREIKQGMHLQDGQIDSPTSTQIDEIIATLDKLIDDGAQIFNVAFDDRALGAYQAAKKWFNEEHDFTGIESQPMVMNTIQQQPVPTKGPEVGEVTTYRKTSMYGFGIDQSVAGDGTRLQDVIDLPDFIQSATFEIKVTEHTTKMAKPKKVSLVIKYNGKTFSPITLDSSEMQRSEDSKNFWSAVMKAYNTKQLAEGQHLEPVKVSRTVGGQQHGGVWESPLKKGLISATKKEGVLNLYDLEFGPDQTDFGETVVRTTPNGPVTYVMTPHVEGQIPQQLYQFDGFRNFAGTIMLMVKRAYSEFGTNYPKVPVMLRAKRMSEGDAKLIIDIITGKYNPEGISGREALGQNVFLNGENTGVTGNSLISILVPRIGVKDVGRSRLHFDIPVGTQTLQIYGRVKGDQENMDVQPREFDLSTEEGRNAFITFATQNMDVSLDNQFMRERFGDGRHSIEHPFHRIFSQPAMVRRMRNGETIKFGESSIAVDINDVVNVSDNSDTRGLSGIAWMIKRGLVETDFDGFSTPTLVVDTKQGVIVKNDNEQKVIEQVWQAPVDQTQQLYEDAIQDMLNNNDYFNNVFNKVQKDLNAGKHIDEAEVRKHLARIFGAEFVCLHVKVQDAVIDIVKDGFVIGRTYHDSIQLSRQAEEGTEYHEAFHRILEIVCPKRLRQMVYNAYRSKKPGAKTKTEKEISELLADDFMYYAMNRPTFKLPHSVSEAFSMIKDYVAFVKSIGSFRLYMMYALTNSGVLNKVITVSRERIESFRKAYPFGKNKVIRGTDLDLIINSAMYRDLKNSLVYLIFESQKINHYGNNIQSLDLDRADNFIRASEIYKKILASDNISQNTKDALKQVLDNWDVVKPDIAAAISKISTDYRVQYEDQNREDLEGDEQSIAGSAINDHTKASYEFSQFSRATSRVKFFFSGILNTKWGIVNGKPFPVPVVNKLGLPEYTNSSNLFNIILNNLHSCSTYDEIINGLKQLAMGDARVAEVYARLVRLHRLVKSGQATANEQALLTQIKTIIHCAKNEFVIAQSQGLEGGYQISIQLTDATYDARQYVQEWQDGFTSGASAYIGVGPDGKFKMKGRCTPNVFINVSNRIYEIIESAQNPYANVNEIKNSLVKLFNSFYIQLDLDVLNFMLRDKYSSDGLTGIQKMFNDPYFNIRGFAGAIKNLTDGRGNLIEVNIRSILQNNGFVKELANAKYSYRHANDQLTVVATGGNKYYVMSENNFITDQTDDLNKRGELFEQMCSYDYNLFETADNEQVIGNKKIGSVALKFLAANPLARIRYVQLAGFKTDQIGDQGSDYVNTSEAQDYIAKAQILLEGGIIMPTLSDKSSWGFISGIPLPGLKFTRIVDGGQTATIKCNAVEEGDIIPDEVVEQMLEYALCEYRSVKNVLTQIESMSEEEREKFMAERAVDNFHKGADGIIQGARFSSLLGVYTADGTFVEFNRTKDKKTGKRLDERANLEIAEEYFFAIPGLDPDQLRQQQKEIFKDLLKRRVNEELEYVQKLGLIKLGQNGMFENVGLDVAAVNAVKDAILGQDRSNITAEMYRAAEDIAIRMVVADISNKHIMSMQEGQRLYYGNPAFYKWKYSEDGSLIDTASDLHKRLGGLGSTGVNNDLEIGNFPEDYTCAEIDDIEIPSEDIETIGNQFENGEFRQAYINKHLDESGTTFDNDNGAKELVDQANQLTLEQIKEDLGEKSTTVIQKIVDSKTKAFNKVNVADGASYISDKMAENLLRMCGSWSSEVERAFKILRGEEVDGKVYTTKDIREIASAYEAVYTAVIGTQKYTAFGFRKDGDVMVPYFNKTALFPLFKCICTGRMAGLYEAMQKQGVDMLMTKGAVKEGGRGSHKIDLLDLKNFTFNKYTQKYSRLRKQLNTDPKEAETMKIGTQSAKVAMMALTPGRQYTVGDKVYSGTEIRNQIMADQNMLSDLGVQEITEEFFDVVKDDEGKVVSKILNVQKLSNILTEELTTRGASSEMLDAVSVIEKDGKKQLKMPMAAMSGLSWIQSILVSRVNKQTVDINAPGAAFIQRSVFGMEHEANVIDDNNLPPSINGGKPLKMINENGSMDCVLSIDFFDHLIPKVPRRDDDGNIIYQKDDDGNFVLDNKGNRKPVMMRMPFKDAREWLIKNGIIGGEANMFAYRIPTQAISSIHALRCVDVLPVVRDTVILPMEFTKITGSDKRYQCSNFKKPL